MLQIMKQTNRTILFDVVNPEKKDLLSLMADVPELTNEQGAPVMLSDSKIQEIHKALLVKSFDEFLEKFKPTIYCYFGENVDRDTGEVVSRGMQYVLERPMGIPKELVTEIVIDKNNDFLRMFINMMETKSSSGTTNINFDYEKLTKMLSPERTLTDIKRLKKEISMLEEKNAEYESDSPAKMQSTMNLINKYENTKKYYNETSVQLKLMLGVLKENLMQLSEASKSGGANTELRVVQTVFSGEEGEMHVFKAPPPGFMLEAGKADEIAGELTGGGGTSAPDAGFSDDERKWLVNATTKDIVSRQGEAEGDAPAKPKRLKLDDYKRLSIERIEKQFDDSMVELYKGTGIDYDAEKEKGSLMRELAVCAFTDKVPASFQVMTAEEKIKKYNLYSQINASWQKAFIRTAKPLIEKILNVKAFFDQYKPKTKLMQPSLLVVNCHVDELAESEQLERLAAYLNTVNTTTDYTNTVWFGIVPDIQYSDFSELADIDIDEMRAYGYTGDIDSGAKIAPVEISTLQNLLNCIKDYKVQVFFGFETNEETSFMGMATGDVTKYIYKTNDLSGAEYSKYAIPCFPNFTVIPNDKSRVDFGSPAVTTSKGELVFSADREESAKFWMYGVYISAAHVAAGLIAACQCPKYLESRFQRGIRSEFPGVRFDIEADSKFVPTTMAKEIGGYTEYTKNILNMNQFGFVFSSDNIYINGQPVKNVYVYKARCLKMLDSGGYESVFKETARTCIYRYLKAVTDDFKKDRLDRMFKSGEINQWQLMASGNYLNSILRQDDSIIPSGMDGNKYNIGITFGGVEENMEVDISSN